MNRAPPAFSIILAELIIQTKLIVDRKVMFYIYMNTPCNWAKRCLSIGQILPLVSRPPRPGSVPINYYLIIAQLTDIIHVRSP